MRTLGHTSGPQLLDMGVVIGSWQMNKMMRTSKRERIFLWFSFIKTTTVITNLFIKATWRSKVFGLEENVILREVQKIGVRWRQASNPSRYLAHPVTGQMRLPPEASLKHCELKWESFSLNIFALPLRWDGESKESTGEISAAQAFSCLKDAHLDRDFTEWGADFWAVHLST